MLGICVLLGVLPCISSSWVLPPLSHALSLFPFLVLTAFKTLFFSLPPCNICSSLHWNCHSVFVQVSFCSFNCKRLQATLSARAQLQIQSCTVPALLSCSDKMYLLLKCKPFFSMITISYLTAFSDITGIQRWEVFSLESGPYA